MKVLPIKLPDEMYEDLKAVSVRDGLPMAEIVREYLGTEIRKKAKTIQSTNKKIAKANKKNTFFERVKKLAYTGPIYNADKTDDELLYGGKFGDH